MSIAVVSLIIIGLVLAAAVVQRMVGLGFGMVPAPFFVVLIGPHEGVMLVNFLAIFAPALLLAYLWRDVEWRKVAWIGIPAVAIMPAAAWVSVNSAEGPLYLAVGGLVLLGLVLTVLLARVTTTTDGPAVRTLSGIGAGAGTVIAGVGGPAMTIYIVLSRWPVVPMIATLQAIWVPISLGSFLTKWAFDDGQLPSLPWWCWLGAVLAIPLGYWIGKALQGRLDERVIKRMVVVVAFIGAVLALATGLRIMLG